MRIAATVLLAACALTGVAQAEPGGTTGVSSPTITAGQTKLEWRSTAFDGGAIDGAWAHRAQIGHAFTDWWRPTLIVRASASVGSSLEVNSVGFENVFDFAATREWPVHFGLLVEPKLGINGRDDSVEIKLLSERTRGPLTLRLNFEAERDIGSGVSEDWAHGYNARATWNATDAIAIGIEGFGDLDESAHAWGPRAAFKFGQTTLAIAYLEGLDNTDADRQLRLALEFTP